MMESALIVVSAVCCSIADTASVSVVASIQITPAVASIEIGSTLQLSATPYDAKGKALSGTAISWSSSDPNTATVSAQGIVQGMMAGVAVVSASAAGMTETVSMTVTPQTGDPRPDASDLILIDSRTRLQQATTRGEAECAIRASPCTPNPALNTPGLDTAHFALSLNMDGNGTRALRVTWKKPATFGDCCGGGYQQPVIPGAPKEVYIQWKHRLGRTSTGGGIGALNSFAINNPLDPVGNAGRKVMLLLRDVPDMGGSGRIDYLYQGGTGVQVTLGFKGLNKGPFQPDQMVGQTIIQTIYAKAESSADSNDGVLRLWVNGQLVLDHIGDFDPWGIHRIQFPSTYRSPAQDQTEYLWDLIVWQPK
ncbi:MAG: Ig-like domain-containing protein [Gemmatimonadota bacterium]